MEIANHRLISRMAVIAKCAQPALYTSSGHRFRRPGSLVFVLCPKLGLFHTLLREREPRERERFANEAVYLRVREQVLQK